MGNAASPCGFCVEQHLLIYDGRNILMFLGERDVPPLFTLSEENPESSISSCIERLAFSLLQEAVGATQPAFWDFGEFV